MNINEKDKAFATEFSKFVNGRMCSAEKTGRELANDHRYLVNEKFKVVLEFIKELALCYENGRYDQRDEWACKLSAEVVNHLQEQKMIYVSPKANRV